MRGMQTLRNISCSEKKITNEEEHALYQMMKYIIKTHELKD